MDATLSSVSLSHLFRVNCAKAEDDNIVLAVLQSKLGSIDYTSAEVADLQPMMQLKKSVHYYCLLEQISE
uniref:Uncharacterized protein n=1 Tax=Oryza sativa subsp. japonica TaxID=39947 RepID=Q6Z3S0_ORYSJ|nr:hypothetical protein [Oryza sativa Japonica Group]